MKASIIKIGNSRGIRIPAKILESLDFKDEAEIEILDNESILLKPLLKKPRQGWEKAFREMHRHNDDELLIDDSLDINLISDLDNEEYETNSSI